MKLKEKYAKPSLSTEETVKKEEGKEEGKEDKDIKEEKEEEMEEEVEVGRVSALETLRLRLQVRIEYIL